MHQSTTLYIGMDVHKESIAVASLISGLACGLHIPDLYCIP